MVLPDEKSAGIAVYTAILLSLFSRAGEEREKVTKSPYSMSTAANRSL